MDHSTLPNTFEPRDLAFLQRFFDNVCAERGLPGGSTAAINLAADLIALYQSGVRDEQGLHRQLDGAGVGGN